MLSIIIQVLTSQQKSFFLNLRATYCILIIITIIIIYLIWLGQNPDKYLYTMTFRVTSGDRTGDTYAVRQKLRIYRIQHSLKIYSYMLEQAYLMGTAVTRTNRSHYYMWFFCIRNSFTDLCECILYIFLYNSCIIAPTQTLTTAYEMEWIIHVKQLSFPVKTEKLMSCVVIAKTPAFIDDCSLLIVDQTAPATNWEHDVCVHVAAVTSALSCLKRLGSSQSLLQVLE